MTAAAFTIFWMKIKLEWHSIGLCSVGAAFGMVFGEDFALNPTELSTISETQALR